MVLAGPLTKKSLSHRHSVKLDESDSWPGSDRVSRVESRPRPSSCEGEEEAKLKGLVAVHLWLSFYRATILAPIVLYNASLNENVRHSGHYGCQYHDIDQLQRL